MKITIKLTDEQHTMIKLRAQLLGFKTISSFAREKLLKNNPVSEMKLKEIHKAIVRQKWDTEKAVSGSRLK